ncbi:MAG: DUF2188 domain-containing protein [Gemmatimonadota bacterium]
MQRTTFEVKWAQRGWVVERVGFARENTHPTKEAALQRATQLARARQLSDLIIRRLDGSVPGV